MLLFHTFLIFSLISSSTQFVPSGIISKVINKIDKKFHRKFGKISKSLTHEEITNKGLIQSVVRYFHDQPNGKHKIDLNKINNSYYDLKELYFDYYGKHICKIPLEFIVKVNFEVPVAFVDFDSKTKDLPYAHFDAETFVQSNQRVIDLTNQMMNLLNQKEYLKARLLSGQSYN